PRVRRHRDVHRVPAVVGGPGAGVATGAVRDRGARHRQPRAGLPPRPRRLPTVATAPGGARGAARRVRRRVRPPRRCGVRHLAPTLNLDPYTLTLVVLETMAVAVVAGLSRPGVAVATALLIGIGQSELTQFDFTGRAMQLHQALTSNLFVVVLFLALFLRRRL